MAFLHNFIDLMQVGIVKKRQFICAKVCALIFTYIQAHLCFMVVCMVGGLMMRMGEGIRLEWKLHVWKFLEVASAREGPHSPSYAHKWSLTHFCAF